MDFTPPNPDAPVLPIVAFKDRILDAVHASQVTVITAETGAGKSTQVPQYLLDAGFGVIVTQPRRLAARALAEWVAFQRGAPVGGEVGYRTAREKVDSPGTRLLFCTDGLQLVRELTGAGVANHETVLVLDEVHEWNTNMETLVAWVKKRLVAGDHLKVVCMSATLEADRLARYFDVHGKGVPIIEVPGALYPVDEHHRSADGLIPEAVKRLKAGKNVLIFQPGKRQIDETIEALREERVKAVILPLHGDLEPEEQEKVFHHYSRPKCVVATNIAQTSITIDDIEVVLDTGLEKRIELVEGIEGLYTRNTSRADCYQRRGRAGRTAPGTYVLCAETKLEDRHPYPIPEIQRVRLDQVVLRLAITGIDATTLEFYHQPDPETLVQARRALFALGAMMEDGEVTEVGRVLARLPLNVRYGRMVYEAMRLHCVPELLTIAACIEVGGLRERGHLWRRFTREDHSDFLAELDLYDAALDLDPDDLLDNGIRPKNFIRAVETRAHLVEALEGTGFDVERAENDPPVSRDAILRAVMIGLVDHVYEHVSGYTYRRGDEERTIAQGTVLQRYPQWLVGLPRDIGPEQFLTRSYESTRRILTLCSEADLPWLLKAAPHLVSHEDRMRWVPKRQTIIHERVTTFNGMELEHERVGASTPEAAAERRRIFADALAHSQVSHRLLQEVKIRNANVRKELERLWLRSGGATPAIGIGAEAAHYERALARHDIVGTREIEQAFRNGLTMEALTLDLDALVAPDARRRIEAAFPDTMEIADTPYAVQYAADDTGFFVRLELTRQEMAALLRDGVTTLTHANRPVRFTVRAAAYADLEDTDLRRLMERVEARRIDLAWNEFLEYHPPMRVRVSRSNTLPELDAPQVYDLETGAKAYPAHEYLPQSRQFHLAWFRTPEEAAESERAAEEGRAWIRLDAGYQAARQQAVNVEGEFQRGRHKGRIATDAQWAKLREARALLDDPDRSKGKMLEAMKLLAEAKSGKKRME